MIYQVTVRTQLGERRGRVELQRAQSALTGALFFLGKETPLRGTVDAQGRCRLEGTIQTLLRTFAFTAEGHLECSCLVLMLRGPFASLTMTVVALGPETR